MRPINLRKPLRSLIPIAAILLAGNAYAADWYVRPSSTGSQSGTNWNNAWSLSNLNWGRLNAGDTVWLAGGSYPSGLSVGASGAAGNPIVIKRVTSADSVPAAAAGWSSSFDSTVVFSGSINFPGTSNVTVDGQVPFVKTVGAQGVKPAGIAVSIPLSGGNGIDGADSGSISNISCNNISLIGPYANPSNKPSGGGGINGINIAPSNNTVTNCTFNRCSIVGTGEAVRASNWNGVIIEYCYIADTANDGQQHEDVMYSYPSKNCIWRYNVINNSPNDGVFFEYGGAVNFYFYGNIYYNSEYGLFGTKAPDNYGPLFIYNNVFHAPAGHVNAQINNGGRLDPASRCYNNIFYNVFNSCNIASDYNAYSYTSLNGYSWPTGEAHSFAFTGDPFVNIPSSTEPVGTVGDFHLTAAMQAKFQKGIVLPSDGFINRDPNGNTRGAGGFWSIGAEQYVVSGIPVAPSAPTNLHLVP